MADFQEVELHGMKELLKAMQELPPKIAKKAVSKALRKGAAIIVQAARAEAPVNTGVLRRNIVARSGGIKKGIMHAVVGVEAGKIRTSGRLTRREKRGEDPFYWKYQEIGFHAVGRRGAKRREGLAGRTARRGAGRLIPGRRFLTHAFDRNAAAVAKAIADECAAFVRDYKA